MPPAIVAEIGKTATKNPLNQSRQLLELQSHWLFFHCREIRQGAVISDITDTRELLIKIVSANGLQPRILQGDGGKWNSYVWL